MLKFIFYVYWVITAHYLLALFYCNPFSTSGDNFDVAKVKSVSDSAISSLGDLSR